MKLIVVSKSTEPYADKYFPNYKKYIVTHPPDNKTLLDKGRYEQVMAFGGGSVIDTAKIICKNSVIAYPTTYAGASRTSHAVVWDDGMKIDVKTKKPVTIYDKINQIKLPKKIDTLSKIDCLCHIMESFMSPNATTESNNLVNKAREEFLKGNYMIASFYAGDAIEITGTNVIHGLSYPLTYKYGIPHSEALLTILSEALKISKVKELL